MSDERKARVTEQDRRVLESFLPLFRHRRKLIHTIIEATTELQKIEPAAEIAEEAAKAIVECYYTASPPPPTEVSDAKR